MGGLSLFSFFLSFSSTLQQMAFFLPYKHSLKVETAIVIVLSPGVTQMSDIIPFAQCLCYLKCAVDIRSYIRAAYTEVKVPIISSHRGKYFMNTSECIKDECQSCVFMPLMSQSGTVTTTETST